MPKLLPVALLLVLLLPFGCRGVDSAAGPIGRARPALASDAEVTIYVDSSAEAAMIEGFGRVHDLAQAPAAGVLVGRIDADGEVSWARIGRELRRRARLLGADTLVVDSWDRRHASEPEDEYEEPAFKSVSARAFHVPAR